MEKWLALIALGALSIWMWIAGGRTQIVPASHPLRTYVRTNPPKAEPTARRSMRLSRCNRCGAYRVEGARCHDSKGYPRS